VPKEEFFVDVAPDSLESEIGYSSLHRQMHSAFVRQVAFYKSPRGGSCTTEEARKRAFHACTTKEDAKRVFKDLMRAPLDSLNFVDLMELQEFAPRVAEWFWEHAKREGRKEFESGHLSANIAFPAGYMKQVWNVARYIGVREAFIAEWGPRGGIELSLIDMMAQTWFQWQYWVEQSVRRSQTPVRSEDPEYSRWKAQKRTENPKAKMVTSDNPTAEEWLRPYVSERDAVEHAVQMAERWQRMFTRALRQLRDLRRYTPVTINNPRQVNIAAEGGQQINLQGEEN
jgi:hypothetical protein